MKKTYLFFILTITLFASINDIEKKIDTNQKKIEQTLQEKKNLNNSIKTLAIAINKEEDKYKEINKVLEDTNTKILLNKLKLSNSQELLAKLKVDAVDLKKNKEDIENGVIDFVIENFAMSMGIDQADKKTLDDVVNKEVYTLIFENAKQEVLDLNIEYIKINTATRQNIDKTKQLEVYISKQEEIKEKYLKLQKKQVEAIEALKVSHKKYQKYLQTIIDKQNSLKDLLGDLNILKKKEIQKENERIAKIKAEQERIRKEREEEARKKALRLKKLKEEEEKKERLANLAKSKQNIKKETKDIKIVSRKDLDDDINIEVKKIGSSNKGIKISKYYGSKTIAPLKSYTITKPFGKYYDEVYKMELFNESISLKTKLPNAKVMSVFKGQVVYAKENSGLLENVVIIKHSNNLHTIYSHLDQIAPTMKVGKWIPKGYVVGRVNDTLIFQATKDSKYIDPAKLFK